MVSAISALGRLKPLSRESNGWTVIVIGTTIGMPPLAYNIAAVGYRLLVSRIESLFAKLRLLVLDSFSVLAKTSFSRQLLTVKFMKFWCRLQQVKILSIDS
jgi:hypothetical protein